MSKEKNKSFHEYDLDFHDGKTSYLEKLLVILVALGAVSEIGQFMLMVIK